MEAEARRITTAMQLLQSRVSDEANGQTAENERVEGNTKGIEERLDRLQVKEGTKEENGAARHANVGSSGKVGGGTPQHITLGGWAATMP